MYSYDSSHQNSWSKSSGGEEWENWRNFRRGIWRKSEEWCDRWSKDGGRYSSFCIITEHLSSEKCWFGGKTQKKGRIVLRGDFVKDDSGSHAVFAEQGSSASQMKATKIMDIIFRLPGCDGQAADAVSACSQVIGSFSQITANSKIRSVQTFGFVYNDTNSLSHGPVWKTQSFLLNTICTVILWHDWECFFVHREKGLFLSVCGWFKIGWKKTKHWFDVETTQQKSRSCMLGMHSKTMRNKQRYCGQLQNHVWIANFSGRTEKLPYSENLRIRSWSYDVEGNAN